MNEFIVRELLDCIDRELDVRPKLCRKMRRQHSGELFMDTRQIP